MQAKNLEESLDKSERAVKAQTRELEGELRKASRQSAGANSAVFRQVHPRRLLHPQTNNSRLPPPPAASSCRLPVPCQVVSRQDSSIATLTTLLLHRRNGWTVISSAAPRERPGGMRNSFGKHGERLRRTDDSSTKVIRYCSHPAPP